jgi:RHS repeat-associated protein
VVIDRRGETTVDYLNGLEVDEKIRQITSIGSLYFLQDHLGSTAALTDGSGNVVDRVQYEPFGESTGSALSRYDYTGRERDTSSKLLFYRSRWYDPQLGIFLTEDPLGLKEGPNAYQYARQNPIDFLDPFGTQVYRQNRRIGSNEAASNLNPLTHTYDFTTKPDGTVEHTYSWGNKANTQGWNKDQPEDIAAATQALEQNRWLRKVGDETLEPYLEDAFNELNKKENEHANWWVVNNCKSEATKLLTCARKKQQGNMCSSKQSFKLNP